MRAQYLVALVFTANGEFTHTYIDAESHILDGGDEESAVEWAYQKFGEAREIFYTEFGDEGFVKDRIVSLFQYSQEV